MTVTESDWLTAAVLALRSSPLWLFEIRSQVVQAGLELCLSSLSCLHPPSALVTGLTTMTSLQGAGD